MNSLRTTYLSTIKQCWWALGRNNGICIYQDVALEVFCFPYMLLIIRESFLRCIFLTNIPPEYCRQKESGCSFMSKEFCAGKSWKTKWEVIRNERVIRLKNISIGVFFVVLFFVSGTVLLLLCSFLSRSGFYHAGSQLCPVSCHAAVGFFTTWFSQQNFSPRIL